MAKNWRDADENENAEKIKAAATKLFSAYGYGSTTVRMIAKEAGLSAGQITAHFGSKEELYNSIVQDIVVETVAVYNPIEEHIENLLQRNKMDSETAWELIEKIVDLQIEFCLEPSNLDKIMMFHVMTPDCETVKRANTILYETTRRKIEMIFAQLIQAYSQHKGYLRSRTISRAVNGAIVSFAEHKDFLLNEVYLSSYLPNSVIWMKEHLKSYVLNSIKAADDIEDF